MFQSPFHRVILLNSELYNIDNVPDSVSIPFSSGHTAELADNDEQEYRQCKCVSIPFSSGHTAEQMKSTTLPKEFTGVSIPFSSGHTAEQVAHTRRLKPM